MSIILFLAAGFLIIGVALMCLVMLGKREDIAELPRDPKFWIEAERHGGSEWNGEPLCVDENPVYNVYQLHNN